MPRLGVELVAAAVAASSLGAAAPVPADERAFLDRNCVACHAGDAPQAGIALDGREIDWAAPDAVARWERVYDALASGMMPPSGAAQPSDGPRHGMLAWLEGQLDERAPTGGSVPRRLNRIEYQNTVRALFGLSDFALPEAFPADDSLDGFDNLGEGLVLSHPLMKQYLELAGAIADQILPPDLGPVVARSRRHRIGADGLDTSEGGAVGDESFRIVSSRNMASVAAWPNRFEAGQSGIYRITIRARPFETDRMFYAPRTEPYRIALYARPKTDQFYAPFGETRKLAELDLALGRAEPQELSAEVELFASEVFGVHWQNGPIYSDPPKRDLSHTFLADRLRRDRLFYAAMLEFRGGPRGTTQVQAYEATRALMESGELDLSDPRLDKLPENWGGGLSSRPHNWINAFVSEEMYRFGPALDLVDIEVEGPLRLVEDDAARARKARTRAFLGTRPEGATDLQHAESVLRRFLPRAFGRPVSEAQVREYVGLVEQHLRERPEGRLEDGLHLAVRRALVSPHFLYRGLRPGPLDAFDLASRLSYFLTSAPPDDRLAGLAREGSLSDPEVLAGEARRLIANARSDAFVSSFTGQWLSTRLLRGIMPDPRLLQFGPPMREAMIDETELFFAEILRENRAIETFVDPGFSYRSARLNQIYGTDLEGLEMRRVTLERDSRHGGVLGLASVMMATANGVDTHPVLRGVWVLENVLGSPTPEPPPDVPAIAPDTSGATTMRDQLNAHRADAACARCHDRIDPVGMILENFDPVGRWREHYPVYTKPPDGAEALKEEYYSTVGKGAVLGPPVDAVATLADGTRLESVTDLKRHVLERIDQFSLCLAEKLLVYATGRPLVFRDRRAADAIVAETKAKGNGFQDLVLAVVQSESFRIR